MESAFWDGFTFVIVLAVYLGFAGVWGWLLQYHPWWPAMAFALLLFLPASLALPGGPVARLAGWMAAGMVVWLTRRCWATWPRRMVCAYFGSVMFLILVWALATWQIEIILALGLPAGLAGGLCWGRVVHSNGVWRGSL